MVVSLVWRSPFVFRIRVSKKAFTFSPGASRLSQNSPRWPAGLPPHLQQDIGIRDGVVTRKRLLND